MFQLWAKFKCNVSYTHSHYSIFFHIEPILQLWVFTLEFLYDWFAKLWRVHFYVFIINMSFFSIWYPWNWCLRMIGCDETNKTNTSVLNMKNAGHWAYLKLLKVKHQNGFAGYLILTGARSQLKTLIKPQYITLHVSGNPRFQYYSKPEWYFLRCWRNVTYLFFTPFSSCQSTLLVYLKVTKSAPCSAA